jgi:DNA-binding SARP family transcriptional activator
MALSAGRTPSSVRVLAPCGAVSGLAGDALAGVNLSPVFRIELLDGFTLRSTFRSSQPVDGGLPREVQRLVAFLGLSCRPARTVVAGRLWPGVPEDQAQASLRSALWWLRRTAPGLVEGTGGALFLAAGVRVDVRELHGWAERVLDPQARGDRMSLPDPALWGDLLPGWCDDWVLLERERVRQHRVRALEAVAVRLAAARHHGMAVQAAHLAVRAEPLRESASRTLVRVYLAERNTAEALRAYHVFRQVLHDELGAAPSEQMTRLVRGLGAGSLAAS